MSDALKDRELAGYVAPIIRNTDERVLRRKVHTYNPETGEVTGEVTMREVVGGLAKAVSLGLEVEGVAPKAVPCALCGRPTKPRVGVTESVRREARARRSIGERYWVIAKALGISRAMARYAVESQRSGASTLVVCRRCANPAQSRCAGTDHPCDAVPPDGAFVPSQVLERKGAPWRCFACTRRRQAGLVGPIVRKEPDATCAGGCGAVPSRHAVALNVRRRRKNPEHRWRCRECYLGPSAAIPPSTQEACKCGVPVPPQEKYPYRVAARGGADWTCRNCREPSSRRTRHASQPAVSRRTCSCGARVSKKSVSGMCRACYSAGTRRPLAQATCITCDAVPKRNYLSAAQVRRRNGRPWQCWECAHGQPRPIELGRPKGWRPPKVAPMPSIEELRKCAGPRSSRKSKSQLLAEARIAARKASRKAKRAEAAE